MWAVKPRRIRYTQISRMLLTVYTQGDALNEIWCCWNNGSLAYDQPLPLGSATVSNGLCTTPPSRRDFPMVRDSPSPHSSACILQTHRRSTHSRTPLGAWGPRRDGRRIGRICVVLSLVLCSDDLTLSRP